MAYSETLVALADPTRRRLWEQLRRRPRAVGDLTRTLRVTQPAVSQHLRVLWKAGLVRSHAVGNKRIYQPDLAGIIALREYLDEMWTDVLAAYADSFNKDRP